MQATLIIMKKNEIVDEIMLDQPTTVFGRDKGDVIIDDKEVSGSHCQIQLIKGEYHLFDLNSTNGTFVNEHRIVKSRLIPNDKIKIGSIDFIFSIKEKPEYRNLLDINNIQLPDSPVLKEIDKLISKEKNWLLSSLKIILSPIYADGTSENIIINERECTLGRVSLIGKFKDDEELSRKHLKILLDEKGKLWVEDAGSTNGVFVNGIKIQKKSELPAKHTIKIGKTLLSVKTII